MDRARAASVALSENVFPARAGMDRVCARTAQDRNRIPRASGDGPVIPLDSTESTLVFPARAGMDRIYGVGKKRTAEVFPARAGMDRII